MELQQRQIVKRYIDILLRRKVLIVAFVLIGVGAGLAKYLLATKTYQCVSLIKYQRQQVNPTRMSPDDLRSQTREAVATISQQITSRTNLEAMIKEYGLYAGALAVHPMEDVVDIMREKHIAITPQNRSDIFQVTYQGSDPRKVQRITNALAAKFIEENLRFREERASATSAYVQDELRMAKLALDKKEAVMRDYKLKYYNEMPDQLQNNLSRLSALQQQYQGSHDSLQNMERTRLLIQEQINIRGEFLRQQTAAGIGQAVVPGAGGQGDFSQLQDRLKSLQARYTDYHPEIRRLKKMLEQFALTETAPEEGLEEDPGSVVGPQRTEDPMMGQLLRQLGDLEFQIKRLTKERAQIEEGISRYEKWVAAAPVREAEWSALTRDYGQLNRHYQELVGRSLEAESAHTLEKRQKGSQFKIVDSAHFPEKPFKPDFLTIMLIATGLGLGVGGGLALGLELLATSFKDPEDLEMFLDLPVVCAVPMVTTAQEAKWQRIKTLLWLGIFVVTGSFLVGAMFYFWRQGVIIL